MCNSAEVWRLVMERKAVRQEYSLFSLCMLNSCLFLFFFSLSLLLAHWRFLHFKRDDLFFLCCFKAIPYNVLQVFRCLFFYVVRNLLRGRGFEIVSIVLFLKYFVDQAKNQLSRIVQGEIVETPFIKKKTKRKKRRQLGFLSSWYYCYSDRM